jgi:hypothetical protein
MKAFRIYRLNTKNPNSYLQYFSTLKEARSASHMEDRWGCKSIQIEYFEEDKWKVYKD